MKPAPVAGNESLRPIRLLLVVDSLDVGGAERHVVDLARTLRCRGHVVTVACSASGALSGVLEEAGIPVRTLLHRLVKRRFSLTYARRLRRLVKEGRFDLVHAHIYASATAAAVATLGTGVPLVITEHTEASWRYRHARWISWGLYRHAKHVIAVSSAIRQRLIITDHVSPARITVVPNAVAPAASAPNVAPPALPVELGGGPLVGVIARLQPEKGVAAFLRAAARVSSIFPEARFLVVGDGPLRQELSTLAERLGVRERVHFLGFQPDARQIIEYLDALVVPSVSEGTPLVVLEAMAAGVPVVASAVGGIPDQIRHGKEGLLIPPGDPVALGEALLKLLRDPANARFLGEASRKRATSEFSYSTMMQRIEAVYYRRALRWPASRGLASEEPEIPITG